MTKIIANSLNSDGSIGIAALGRDSKRMEAQVQHHEDSIMEMAESEWHPEDSNIRTAAWRWQSQDSNLRPEA